MGRGASLGGPRRHAGRQEADSATATRPSADLRLKEKGMLRLMRTRRLLVAASLLAAISVAGDAVPEPRPSGEGSSSARPARGEAIRAPELEAAVRAIVADSSVRSAKLGIAILDIESGTMLAASGEHLPLNPASNAKLFTAATALSVLHGDHRYETTLSGNLKGGAVAGPLILKGYGDPSLATDDLWALVQELRTYGVKRVDGDILVDQSFFDEQTTPPAFEQQPNEWSYFRAPVSAVSLNENCVTMTVRPAGAGGAANVAFDPPGFVDVDGTVKTGGEGADNVVLALSANGQRLAAHVAGAIAEGSRLVRYTKRVEDPTLLAGYALKALLERAEIKVSGEVRPVGTPRQRPSRATPAHRSPRSFSRSASRATTSTPR